MKSKLKMGFAICAFMLLALCGRTYACSCAQLTLTQQLGRADAVFLGTVVKKQKSEALEKNGVEVTLKVETVWKGKLGEEVAVYTGATDDLYSFMDLCAVRFIVGEKYVVFANGEIKLATDVCSGSAGDSEYFRKELGIGAQRSQQSPRPLADPTEKVIPVETTPSKLVRLTNKRVDPPSRSRLPTRVVDEETYHKVLDLVFPRDVLKDQKSDYAFVLRYEPAFRAESQITITGRGGNIEVVKYTALDGSIEARLSDMVRRGRKQDVRRMARLIRIQKQYINVSSQDIKRFHESFFNSLRLSERARVDAAKDRINITADGTAYRLWYSGQTEVQSEFGGSNITTQTRPDESPLLDWMKGVYLKVAASEIAHR